VSSNLQLLVQVCHHLEQIPTRTGYDDDDTNRQETTVPSQERNQDTRSVASSEDTQNALPLQHLAAKDAL